ncbi:MAG TPA: LysM domain-containing protein [Oligoflexus sp.]|uniref:LysM peptidoglycan-binding domain-containing protein n=1 Tax=Oligoflexus sp. TaxID=1971216 RepID=UPI002D80A109|nr:LysM domain-containing protein [Oligoflexus sp.]HET9239441.1 LysM domain-containing protein [Oligoflexus sp.]
MNRKIAASLTLLAFLTQNAAWAKTYNVKKGDTLSHIAAREFGQPIYGPKGSLRKLLEKNPEIQNPDRIRPTQAIRLSDELTDQSPKDAISKPDQPAEPIHETLVSPEESSDPAPASEPAQDLEPKRSFGIKMGLGLVKDEMEAVDHERSFKTTLDSELQTAMDLDAYYKPGSDSRVGLSLGLKNAEFKDTDDGRFEGGSDALYKLSLFGEMTFMNRLHLGLELGTEQSFFFKQLAIANFGLEAVFVDFAKASLGYDVVIHESWRWSLGASGSFHAPASAEGQDIRKGSSYTASTQLSYEWKSGLSLEGSLQYERRSQGIDGIRQKVTGRGAGIALRYEF